MELMSKLNDIWNSFKDGKDGLGAKRLTAFAFMVLIAITHIVIFCYVVWGVDELKIRTSFKLLEYFFYMDCAMLALLLGIITSQQLIELKNGNKPTDNQPQ